MTSLNTGAGMLPLAMGIGEGSSLIQPPAVAVVGALSVSTFLTLFVVPSADLILHGRTDVEKGALPTKRSDDQVATGEATLAADAGD